MNLQKGHEKRKMVKCNSKLITMIKNVQQLIRKFTKLQINILNIWGNESVSF